MYETYYNIIKANLKNLQIHYMDFGSIFLRFKTKDKIKGLKNLEDNLNLVTLTEIM